MNTNHTTRTGAHASALTVALTALLIGAPATAYADPSTPAPPPPTATGHPGMCLSCAVNRPQANVGTNIDASDLAGLINDARLHPQNYPPTGNTAGAAMAACATPFVISPALEGTAQAHNSYLATEPISGNDGISTPPNMHKDPDGTLATDVPGGPIAKAGYKTRTGEVVAWGQTTALAALQAWMQNDADSQWGHRNLILNCALTQAGPAHLQGGLGGDYWTVDMGTP
jgi:hypothetical protein